MRIDHSIQDFIKRINSFFYLTFTQKELETIALFSFSFLIFAGVMGFLTKSDRHILTYLPGSVHISPHLVSGQNALLFGSKTGNVYYYSWCKAGQRIKEGKQITFSSEEEAKESGRTLSKLCE